MTSDPFVYSREQIDRSYRYNYGGYQKGYAHYGIFAEYRPVGSFQLKRMDEKTGFCEFGIILQSDEMKGKGFGTAAVQAGMEIAKEQFGMKLIQGDTFQCNAPMRRIFDKLGFQLYETVPGAAELAVYGLQDRLVYRKSLIRV